MACAERLVLAIIPGASAQQLLQQCLKCSIVALTICQATQAENPMQKILAGMADRLNATNAKLDE